MIHPEIAAVLAGLPRMPPGPLDPVALRRAEAEQVPPPGERGPQLYAVTDTTAPTPAGPVPVRIYSPSPSTESGLLIYCHGGAFFLGSLDTHDAVARNLAQESGLKVISVGFRLAPEHPFPAGLHDCYGVVRWAAEHGSELGWDGRTLAIAGDSSGATFAAAVSGMAHDDALDVITHQVLFYPSLDLDFDTERYPSLRENATGYGLETADLKPFNGFYLDSGADPGNPHVSPIKRADLRRLPPALIITAEHDPLRDEGERYGRRLQQAGVEATISRYAGANHGFVQHFSWIPEYHRAFTETADFLNRG